MLRYFELPLFCASFLGTVAFASLGWRFGIWGALLFYLSISILVGRAGVFCLIGGILGIVAFGFAHTGFSQVSLFSNTTVYSAQVLQNELRPGNKQRLTLFIEGEKVLATLPRHPLYENGESVAIRCIFEKPQPFSGFAYDKYLYAQGIEQLCHVKEIELGESIELSLFERGRIWVATRIKEHWPRPISSLVAGLLLGTRESFSQQVLSDFSRSGVTHIIALSGFNITILILFFEKMLILFSIPKMGRSLIIVVCIVIFTAFVGAGASILRAAIMGSIAFIASNFAQRSEVSRLMLFTAFIMTLINPFALMFDVGLQLSFLSTLGLVYLTPLFSRMFRFLPEHFSFRESFTTTMAATIGTLPLILFQFGVLSVVSPMANVLILPIIPWIMLTGLLGVISPIAEVVFIWLTTLGGRYVLWVSHVFALPHWASKELVVNEIGFFFSICFVVFLMFISRRYEAS